MTPEDQPKKLLYVQIPGTTENDLLRDLYINPIEYKLDLIRHGITTTVHPSYTTLKQYFQDIGVEPVFEFAIVRNPMLRIASLIRTRKLQVPEFLDGTAKLTQPELSQTALLEGVPEDFSIYKYETDIPAVHKRIFLATKKMCATERFFNKAGIRIDILLNKAVMQKVIELYENEFIQFGYEDKLAEYKGILGIS